MFMARTQESNDLEGNGVGNVTYQEGSNSSGFGETYPLLENKQMGTSLTSNPNGLWRVTESNGQQHKHHRSCHIVTPEYRRQRYEDRKQMFGCALAMLSGFSDVLCYHSFGCYGNMMTGNTIRLMDLVAAGRWSDASYPAVLVPAYVMGAGLCTYLNRLDLTVLGLGGPSQQAFRHLNPPHSLRTPQQISVLRVVAVGCVLLFLVGEAFGLLVQANRWRLPFFACAFGLLNAATLAAIHIVTNAVTGHWITVGLCMADDLPVLLNRQSSTGDADNATNSGTTDDPPQQRQEPPRTDSQKKWRSSMTVTTSFVGSVIITSVLYNECLREVEHQRDWPLALLFMYAPPMGVVFSVLYAALLYWYTLPPPFLQGFTSCADVINF
jgi:uncharacterized membrane protein YoaK (UPF0700 family)